MYIQCWRDGELLFGRKDRESAVCVPHPAAAYRDPFGLPLCGISEFRTAKTEGGFLCTHIPFPPTTGGTRPREVRDLRKLLFSALMIALCIVLAQVPSVPLFGGAKVTWGFLARSVCAWVCGPVLGLLFAFAEDILSFFLTGGGGYPFFPGYTLTTMLGVLTYALFLYRAPLRVWRIFCAKLVTNVQNVVLGGAVDRHSQQQRPLQPGGLVCQRVSQRGEKPHHAASADGAAGAPAAGAAAGPSADGDAAPAGGGGQAD